METVTKRKTIYAVASFVMLFLLITGFETIEFSIQSSITPFLTICIIALMAPVMKVNSKMMLISVVLGSLLAIANFDAYNIIGMVVMAIASSVICYGCLEAVLNIEFSEGKTYKNYVYWIIFGTIAGIYLIYYFAFSGTITTDAAMSFDQIQFGEYNNMHPFLYTFTLFFFKDNYILYFIIQILFMAGVVTYGIATVKRPWIAIPFIIIPYYMNWATSMIKDTFFACFVLLFVISIYRFLKGEKKYVLFGISIIGSCLYRLNGSLCISITLLLLLFVIKNKKSLTIPFIVLGICYFIKYFIPVILNLASSDITESTTLMQQQIAYVLQFEKGELTQEANKFLPIEKWRNLYSPFYSDDLKYSLRTNGYVQNHITEYFNLWKKIGNKYPLDYIRAFLLKTRFYYNGAYVNDNLYWTVPNYDFPGIVTNLKMMMFLQNYNSNIEPTSHTFLRFFLNIDMTKAVGFNTWILIGLYIRTRLERKKEFIILIPFLVLLLTNIFLAPVAEFRYMLPLYFALPILFPMILKKGRKNESFTNNTGIQRRAKFA